MLRRRILSLAICALPAAAPALAAPPADDAARDARVLATRIDQVIADRWARDKITPAPRADDADDTVLGVAGQTPESKGAAPGAAIREVQQKGRASNLSRHVMWANEVLGRRWWRTFW